MEKDQIKRAVKDLEKEQIAVLKKEKELELEREAQEANRVKRRQKELVETINKLEQDAKERQKIYEENERKLHEPQELAQKVSDAENLRRRMFEEKTQRIADIRSRQNNLLGEKNLIEKMEAEMKDNLNVDREGMAKAQERVATNAQRHLDDVRGLQEYNIDSMKKRLAEKENKLESLKNGDYISPKRDIRQIPDGIDINHGSRPMSKKAMAGQSSLATFAPRMDDDIPNGLTPALEVVNNRQSEVDRLRDEVETLKRMIGQSNQNSTPAQNYGYSNGTNFTFGQPVSNDYAQPMQPQYTATQNLPASLPTQSRTQPLPPRAPQPPPPAAFAAPPQYAYPPHPVYSQPPRMVLPPAGGPKDFDDFLTTNFMQNQVKNVDLNEDERMLVHLTMMEADSLRMLNRIPETSELYRFKLEQYKELSAQRAEVEKLIQETKLKKMKRTIEMRNKEEDRRFDNQRFIDDVRKQEVAHQLAKKGKLLKPEMVSQKEGLADLNPKPNVRKAEGGQNPINEGEYNLNYGFTVHWDYVFGIPKNQNFCQLAYAVMNGDDTVLEPQLVPARQVQDQSTQKNQCVIYENNNLREIEPNKFTNLIIEVQMPKNPNDEEDYVSLGWTFINLFDVNLQLNRGKFKMPLYAPPIYTNVTKEAVSKLRPVMECMILFRISYPWKDEFSNLKNLEPHLNHREYQIPALHIQQASIPGVMSTDLFGEKTSKKRPVANDSEDMIDDSRPNIPARRPQQRAESRDRAPSTTTKPETPHDLIARSKGIKVIVHGVNNYKPPEKVRIAVCIMSSQFVVRDDMDQDTRKSTTVHNPKGKDPDDGPGASDKRQPGNRLSFEETMTYMLNVPKRVRQDRKDLFLCIKVYETGDVIGAGGANNSMSQNMGGKYQLKGWYCHKINEPNGKVIVGTFEENLFSPPEKTPPIDPKDFLTIASSVEYSIEELTGTTTRRKLD